MRFAALDAAGVELSARTYYSVGGGFVLGEDEAGRPAIIADPTPVPYPTSRRRVSRSLRRDESKMAQDGLPPGTRKPAEKGPRRIGLR